MINFPSFPNFRVCHERRRCIWPVRWTTGRVHLIVVIVVVVVVVIVVDGDGSVGAGKWYDKMSQLPLGMISSRVTWLKSRGNPSTRAGHVAYIISIYIFCYHYSLLRLGLALHRHPTNIFPIPIVTAI